MNAITHLPLKGHQEDQAHDDHSLTEIIEHLRHLLPAQSPLEFFVHHNTLHAFEHLNFHEALKVAGKIYGSKNCMHRDEYIKMLNIYPYREEVLEKIRKKFLSTHIAKQKLLEKYQIDPAKFFSLSLINHNMNASSSDAELDAEEVFRHWSSMQMSKKIADPRMARIYVERFEQRYFDTQFIDYFIEFFMGYFDQTISKKSITENENSFYNDLYFHLSNQGIKLIFNQPNKNQSEDSLKTIETILNNFKIPHEYWENWITGIALTLPGWAGIINVFEVQTQFQSIIQHRSTSLTDYLSLFLEIYLQKFPYNEFTKWKRFALSPSIIQLESMMAKNKWHQIVNSNVIPDTFNDIEQLFELFDIDRGIVWQETLEACYRKNLLSVISQSAKANISQDQLMKNRPTFQAMFCIDDREESLRRYLEQLDPKIQTAAVAGFFAVDMNLKLTPQDPGFAHCPVFVKPKHQVNFLEKNSTTLKDFFDIWTKLKLSKQTSLVDFLKHLVFAPLAIVFYMLRLTIPSAMNRLYPLVAQGKYELPTSTTLTIEVQAQKVEQILKMAGFVKNFAQHIFVVAHGSTNHNNPLFSAYECGACAGRHGDHNAMVFCTMANNLEVRQILKAKNISIPSETQFVPMMHDTCQSKVHILSTQNHHQNDQYAPFLKLFDEACNLESKERVRRFPDSFFTSASMHCLHRSHTLDEARPEYGHATNASVIVGPRTLTQNTFLDRRSFLVDYHSEVDASGDLLKAIISAIFPVCSGINLEYFFGRLDPQKYGSGSKLPHNVTGNIGIMNGKMSDLRPGLAEQMTEIHDPIRLTFVFYCTKEKLLSVLEQLPWSKNFIENQWFFIYVLTPELSLVPLNDFTLSEDDILATPIQYYDDALKYSKDTRFVNCYLSVHQSLSMGRKV